MQTPSRTDDINVISALLSMARRRGKGRCALVKREGRWVGVSWEELAAKVLATAAGLRRLGVKKGDRVALLSTTRLEWTISDCAIMAAGAITVPIYCSLTAESISRILRDSAPAFAIIEDVHALQLFSEAMQRIGASPVPVVGLMQGVGACTLEEIALQSTAGERLDLERSLAEIGRDDAATYVYTSGTTGEYKGVVITHGMILAEVRSIEVSYNFAPGYVGFMFLPLAHVLGRIEQFYVLLHGSQLAYAESWEKLAANYREARPHFVVGVPRMLEKIQESFFQAVSEASPAQRRIAAWALRVGGERSRLVEKHLRVPLGLVIKCFIGRVLVFRKLRKRLGGRLDTFISGGGKLSEEVARFFHAAGIRTLDGYGLTETFAAVIANRPDEFRFGTVGKPLQGVSVKIAPDGEILLKGPMVFREYLHRPEDTRNAFDEEGWFRTGDLGEFSRDGFLRITGRKKELIVTAGGKNIAPQMIEALMANSPYINHIMIYGDGRKFLTALVTLNENEVLRYLQSVGEGEVDRGRLSQHEAVRRLIGSHIEEQNQKLAKFETIKRFAILENDFSIATGELTPTLKVRRDFTSAKYGEILDSLYRE